MRPPDQVRADYTRQWREKAENDYRLSKHLLDEETLFTEAIVFHCQQAAEKYLKAFLTSRGLAFPKTHSLAQLLDLIAPVEPKLAEKLRPAIALTPYGVLMRYPGDSAEVSLIEAKAAMELTEQVRAAVMEFVSG